MLPSWCSQTMFESSVKEKDHQTDVNYHREEVLFESSVKEKDHQTASYDGAVAWSLRAV